MEVLRLSAVPLEEAVQRATQTLQGGGVVLYPTDTLYGLAVDALNPAAISCLKRLKARETRKPISVVVPSVEALEEYAHMCETSRALAARHLPGALTLVLPATGKVHHDILLNGALGLRVPDNTFSLMLARAFGKPFTATSANMSGLPTMAEVDEILAQLGAAMQHVDLVIDAGPRDGGTPSTVVTVIEGNVHVLRQGAIPKEALGL